jgi:transcriptional regulator with XRE-family HTH domain
MSYAGDHIFRALREARQEKGLSQRELSALAGVPQSHISKIESGAVNIQLSGLLELARALDLEIVPVPRKLVPAVEAIVRRAEPGIARESEDWRLALGTLRRIRNRVRQIEQTPENTQDLFNLQRTASELENYRLGEYERNQIRNISELLTHPSEGAAAKNRVHQAAQELQRLRNSLAHRVTAPSESVRPAYSLDEGEDNG